jgi:hypothetical protein
MRIEILKLGEIVCDSRSKFYDMDYMMHHPYEWMGSTMHSDGLMVIGILIVILLVVLIVMQSKK